MKPKTSNFSAARVRIRQPISDFDGEKGRVVTEYADAYAVKLDRFPKLPAMTFCKRVVVKLVPKNPKKRREI